MKEKLGGSLSNLSLRTVLLSSFCFSAVALDLMLAGLKRDNAIERLAIGIIPFLALWFFGDRKWDSLGLRLPIQPWRYWIKISGILGGVGLLAAILGYVFQDYLAQQNMNWKFSNWISAGAWFLQMGLRYPLIEEIIYRGLLCSVLLPRIGFWPTVVADGLAFSGLHYLWGVAEPINLVAGFLLSWSFLKSGSLLVPFLFHSLGNIVAGLAHLPF